jgi:uncharacterized repeat protein (TIGR01451 family)
MPTPLPTHSSAVVPASASVPAGQRANLTPSQATPQPVIHAAGNQPAPVPQSPTSVGPAPGASQSPSLLVEKRAPDTLLFGQPLTYEVVVRNLGPTPVYHVRVDDELPPGVRYLGGDPLAEMGQNRLAWQVGTLEPGAERKLRVDLQPQAEGEIRSVATVSFCAAAVMRTQVVQPRLAVAVRGPEQVVAGENVPFQIQVSNPGSGQVTGLVLRGKLPPGLQHPQGSLVEADLGGLAPGETRAVTLTTVAAQGGAQLAAISASADGNLEAGARASVTVLEANLKLRRTGPSRCFVKSEAAFELEVTNPGSAPADNAQLVDTLPAGLDFVSATEGGSYDATARTITWRLGAVAPGGRRTFGYRVKAVGLGEQTDKAVVQADRGLEVAAETAFNVEGVPALQMEVVDLEDPTPVGGELTYEVRVVNQGSCPCTNIQIIAQVPDGLQPTDCRGPTGHRGQGSQIVFDPLPKLATKADVVYRMTVRGQQPGDYRFRVQMTCDQLKLPVNQEESSRVYKD